jgi:predicted HicB family RNase H-like nuclease
MEYKGYRAKVEFDEQADLFHGEVIDTRDVITFQGRSVDELKQAFKDSVDDYLDWCAERGKQPEKPFSGKLMLRMEPELHRSLSAAAARAGKSLNAWIAERQGCPPWRLRAPPWRGGAGAASSARSRA